MPAEITIDMQMTTYDMATLENLVEHIKPMHAIEIGSWKGLSTSILCRHCAVVYCVDTWAGADNEPIMQQEAKDTFVFLTFLKNIRNMNFGDKVRIMAMSSDQAKLIIAPGVLSFIYIDGDHSYGQVKKDLEWFDLLLPGGVMAGHDFDEEHKEVKLAVTEKFGDKVIQTPKSSIWYVQKDK